MSAIETLMDAVTARAETTNPYAPIVYGSDPPYNGICMIHNGGYAPDIHMDAGRVYSLPVLLNGKHENQLTALNALQAIHDELTRPLNWRDLGTEEIQVISIETTSAPTVVGREQNNQWAIGSAFNIRFYWRNQNGS